MNPLDAYNRVIAALHRAMLDDAHWPAASALIDEAVGATGNALLIGDGSGDDTRVAFYARYLRGERQPDLEREYLQDYHPWDERVPRVRMLPDCRLTHITELYTERELKTSRSYNEFSPRTNSLDSLNVRLVVPDGSHLTWGVSDPLSPGGWRSEQLDLIAHILPHLRQFVLVRQALAAADALGAGLAGLLDNGAVGVIHLDRSGRPLAANALARAILARADGFSDHRGVLGAWLPAEDRRLQRLLARALPGFGGATPSGGSMTVSRRSRRTRLALHVCPVGGAQADFGGPRVAALLLIVDPAGRPRIDPAPVAATLGLTPAEARVAALLAEGGTVRDIAAATGYRESYVRSILKATYKKQGVSGQAGLVRLVLAADALPRS